jgi:predicted MPP superfamily phosphohydrolase
MIRVIIFLGILILVDLYVFQGIRFLIKGQSPIFIKSTYWIYWITTLVSLGVVIAGLTGEWREWPKPIRTYLFAFVFINYFSKLFMVIFLLIDDLFRAVQWTYLKFSDTTPETLEQNVHRTPSTGSGITRSDFLVKAGAIIAAIPFSALLIGMMKGKYEYQVRNYRLRSPRLPFAFDGYRVVQISDLHVGSFTSNEPLEEAVKMINNLEPDVILVTGDLVNDRHDELTPFVSTLSKLSAKDGVFSILGNHDYGDYFRWGTESEKKENLRSLISMQKEMGWDLLLDEHRTISRGGSKLELAGVQNWSNRRNFARYGDLDKSIHGINGDDFTILMSHDPSHWRGQILDHRKHIDLTLSGHTHGFQFGVKIPGFKWSPVQYVYKEWSGHYEELQQSLYVNTGLGFLGYPGRVGILPEITMIELKHSDEKLFQPVIS